ncbi:MAG: class I SAM-dependent methyltransferase, partial [Mycobacterium sp.]|nr:class I SAM-dependent methyltransferase [Mycobacterium sp.]
MDIDTTTGEDHTLVSDHRAVWALGDYALMAEQVMAPLGPVLVSATGIGPGDRVLDVAAGSGNISIPAAKTGASVVSSDLTPELLERSQKRAAEHGVALQWQEANAEALPFADGEFDTVISAIGVMFAPHHQLAA